MEDYGSITLMFAFAGFWISIFAGIVHAAWKRTLKYIWLFACLAGFCFFTTFIHLCVLLDYDDISSPNYETYKDWNTWTFILSDIKRLVFWLGIGVLNYLAFIRKNKIFRCLCILGICAFFVFFLAIPILFLLFRITAMGAIRY